MNSKKGRCRASMNYDNVHEKCPKKPCTRFCTRFCGANMALCGTIKHHGQCDIQAFTALWSVMALYKTGGYASSLSATNAENQQIAKQTPSFTPKNVKSGVFVLFKIIQPLHNKRVAILKESDEKRLIFIYPFSLIFQDFTSS